MNTATKIQLYQPACDEAYFVDILTEMQFADAHCLHIMSPNKERAAFSYYQQYMAEIAAALNTTSNHSPFLHGTLFKYEVASLGNRGGERAYGVTVATFGSEKSPDENEPTDWLTFLHPALTIKRTVSEKLLNTAITRQYSRC